MQTTDAEKQSGLDRVRYAEGLIQQLPVDHEGRNTWLLNYGTGDEAQQIRARKGVRFIDDTQAAATFHECFACGVRVETGQDMDGCRDPDCPENG